MCIRDREGLSELISTLKTIRKKYNPYLDIEGVVFTMFSLRYNLTVQVVEQVQKYFGSKVYKTCLLYTSLLWKAFLVISIPLFKLIFNLFFVKFLKDYRMLPLKIWTLLFATAP